MTSKSKLVNLTFHKLEVNWFLTSSHTAWCLDDLAPLIDTIEALSRAKLAMNPVHSFAVLSVPFLTDHRGKSLVEWCEYVPGSNASINYNPKCDYANCEFQEEAILCLEHLQRCVLKQSYKVIGADVLGHYTGANPVYNGCHGTSLYCSAHCRQVVTEVAGWL